MRNCQGRSKEMSMIKCSIPKWVDAKVLNRSKVSVRAAVAGGYENFDPKKKKQVCAVKAGGWVP